MRCFLAVSIPAEIRKELADFSQGLKDFGRLNRVKQDNIHVTLKFLGEVGENKLSGISSAMDSIIESESFEVSFKGVGVFPNPSRPRVVWAGVERGFGEVVGLHERVDGLLDSLGFSPDERFHPHATIARVRSLVEKKDFKVFLGENEKKVFGSYRVDRVDFMESKLTADGSEYSTIKSVTLK